MTTHSTHVPVARLWLAVLAGYLALGATLQELPAWLESRFHAGTAVVGVLVGLAFAGTALGRPFAGRAGDNGHSRAIALSGAVLTATAGLVTVLAPDIEILAAARLLMGVGEAALFSATLPWVLRVADPARSGRIAGWFGLSMWSGLSVGPVLAIAAQDVAGTSAATWWVVVALPLVAAVILLSTTPVRSPTLRRPGRPVIAQARGPLVDVGMPGVVLGLAAYGYGSLTALLVLYLARPGLGGRAAGLALFSGAFLLTRAACSSLVDRYGGRRVAQVILVVQAGGLAVLAEARSPSMALAGVAVTGLGLGLIYPATTKMTLYRATPGEVGAAVGAMTSLWDTGILAAGILSGAVAAELGFRAAYLLASALALLAFGIVGRSTPLVAPRRREDTGLAPTPPCRESRSAGGLSAGGDGSLARQDLDAQYAAPETET